MIAGKVLGYGLLASVLLNAGLGFVLYATRADNRALEAQVAPLKQAVADAGRINEGYRTALQECELEKVRLAIQVADAEVRAAQAAADADAANEDFLSRMERAGEGCKAILEAKVCPLLMDY